MVLLSIILFSNSDVKHTADHDHLNYGLVNTSLN